MAQTAIVTGCAGGIGQAICAAFVRRGYQVVGIDCRKCDLDLVVTHVVDLADPEQIKRFCASFDTLDALVNVAAVQTCRPFWELTTDEWDRGYNVNVRAPWLLCKHLKAALQRAGGAVVNIASVHATATSAGISGYASTKAALVGLTRNLALEFAPFGVRVNSVSPGAIDTPMLREGLGRAAVGGLAQDDVWKQFEAKHPLGSVGQPGDIAEQCLFLCDRATNRFTTGSNIVIDGGVLCRLCTE